MTSPRSIIALLRMLPLLMGALLLAPAGTAQGAPANIDQQLVFAGLRSVNAQGMIEAVVTDAAGDLYLLFDQGDGVRLLEVANDGSVIKAQAMLGAKGDSGAGLAIDPGGNLYVSGTATSGTLQATAGAAIGAATPGTINSFVAKFDANLNDLFLTFTGGSRIVASSIAASGDAVFVSGITYGSDLPVTPDAIEQAPAFGSVQNGFVEKFSADGTTLEYATYITGALGDTTPTGIAVDAGDDAWLVGSTSASGFATVAAIVPETLSTPSGFLMRLTPAGDGIVFSTFVPGPSLSSVSLDSTGEVLLVSGAVALGQFPVDTVYGTLVPTQYQVLLQMPLDGSRVLSGSVIAPGYQSVVTAAPTGGAWIGGDFSPASAPLLAQPALATLGTGYAAHVTAAGAVDQTVRAGGLADQNQTFAGVPVLLEGLAADAAGDLFLGGTAQPYASVSLLAAATFDLPLRSVPTAALPSSIASTEIAASDCGRSQCAGSGGYLAKISTAAAAPALTFSLGDLPFVVLRNLGSAAAAGLQLTTSAGTLSTTCSGMLGPGAECDLLLSGGQAGTLTASTTSGMTEIAAFPAYTASPPASSVVFAPKELDFGVQTAASPPAVKTVTLTNLGSASETLLAGILLSPESTSPFAPGASDCALGSPANTIQLAAGADCHISVDFTASASSLNDGFQQGALTIGAAQVLLTGYTQAATLSVSASEIDFGKEFQGGIILPRYLFLSNSSVSPVPHASVSLPQTSPFTVIDGCPAMLAAASNCRIEIDYESAAPPADDSATLTLDQGISVLLTGATEPPLDLGGSTVNPALNVSPSAITFGSGVAVTGVSTATQTVGITNAGDSAFSLSVALSGDFTSISSCPSTLAAGATCAVALQFAPSQPGNRQGLLAVTAGAGTPAVDVALSGTGTPILAANNGVLAAGAVPVGQPLVQFFKITQPFASLAASVTGPFRVTLIEDAGFGPGNPPSSDFVPSGEGSCHNCWVAVRFQPVAAGAQNGALTLASTPQGLPYVLQLVGSGLATSGLIVTPSVQDFGAIPLHSESGAVIFSLTNEVSGGAAITVSAPSASGAFQLPSLPGGGSPCAGSLAFGATCSLAVAFAPTSVGPQTGSLTLTTSAGTASASLSGTGTPDPGVAIAPLALNFVNGAGGSATVQNVVITNTGPVTVQVGPSTHADPHFIATTNCGALPPAASCSIRAEFVPAATLASDTLLIPVTAPGSNGTPQTSIYPVTLTGSYTSGGAELGISPAMVNFGPTAVATLGQLRQFTVSNLTAQALQLSTSLPRNYSLAGAPCTSLAANGSCSLQVQFVPLTNGDLPGTMTILGAPADGSTALSSVAYAEGFGVGTGALTLSGGLIVEGIYNFGQVAAGQTATNTFTAQNNGPSGSPPITVRRVTSAPPFFSTTNCGLPLAVGKSCTVAVTYTPAGPSTMGSAGSSADQGSLIIQSDAQSSPDTVNLLGQSGPGSGVTALNVLSMTRSSLTFPATSVGDSSPAQSVTLTNSGNIPIQVTSAFATPDFTVQSGCNTLSAGAECTIQVASTPQSPGIHLAALEISSNAGTSLEYVSLVGTGTAAPLSLSPVALDFGSVQVGSSASLPVTASNSGSAPITFTSISATGDFSTLGNCPASGSSLAAESSCTVQVTFAPSAPGLRSGTLAFTTSASSAPLEVSLSGIGTQSQLVVTPASLSFGPILVGAAANLSLMLVNSGSASLRGLSFVADGDFSVTGPCPQTALSPGASCNLQIGFSPSATGTRTGTLSIASSSPGTPTLVPLTGTGISNATFKLSVNGGTSASLTVVSGQFGTFALLVTPAGGFGGNVALTCTPVQTVEFASCALQPPLVSLGSGAQSSMASINTIDKGSPIATVLSPPVASPDRTFLALALPGVLLLLRRGRTPRRWLGQGLAVAAILLILTASGCGGGSNIHFTPPGTYQFVVTANSTSGAQVTQTVTLNLQVTPR